MSELPSAAPVVPPAEEVLEPAAETERQFHEEVLPDELAYVRDRRASHGLADDATPEAQPEVDRDLVGLALSGGGIRSATFNLGILQALHRRGFLRWVDYLSTVSGGGFIGSALTALASENARKGRPHEPESFPFEHRDQASEPETLSWLRGHSEYLAPSGVFDYLRAFALFTRGISLNLLLLLPILLTLGLLGTLIYDDVLYAQGRKEAWIGEMAAALADRWGSEPTEEMAVDDVLAELATFEGLDREQISAALEVEPPLIVLEVGENRSYRFADRADWSEIMSRLASVEETRPWERVFALDRGILLSYSHLHGLWQSDEFSERALGHLLWTDQRPVSAAAISPDSRLLAAVGYDGSVWVWSTEAGLGRSRRFHESRHSRSGPLTDVRFSAGGQWLVATGAKQEVLVWRILAAADGSRELQPLWVHKESPVCKGCTLENVSGAQTASWVPQYEEGQLIKGESPVMRVQGLPKGTLRLAERWVRQPIEGVQVAARFDFPRKDPTAAETTAGSSNVAPMWNPEILRLETSFRILKWLLLAFVLLYPLLIILRTPLKATAETGLAVLAGTARAFTWLARTITGRAPRRPAAAEPDEPPTVAEPAERKKGGRGLFAILVLNLLFLQGMLVHNLFPWRDTLDSIAYWASMLLLLWWVQSVVLFVPMLRVWSSRPGRSVGSRSITGAVFRLVLLLLPCAYVANDQAKSFGWVLAATWFVLVLFLAAPLLRVGGSNADETDPRRGRIRHRRLTARLYAAAGLLPWLTVLKAVAVNRGGYVEQAITALFEDGGLVQGGLGLARLACALFLIGLGFFLWKVFARLASGRAELATEKIRRAHRRWTNRISGFKARNAYERAFGLALLALLATVFLEVQRYLVYYYHRLIDTYAGDWTRLLIAFSFLVIVLTAMSLPLFKGVGKKVILLILGLLGPLLPFLVYLRVVDKLVYADRWAVFRRILHPPDALDGQLLALFLLITIIAGTYLLGKLVDANVTGMHGFYRDRLSQAYLVGIDTDGRLGPEDQLELTGICPPGSGAPYHLLNASLNMQGAGEGALRWRNSDFFVFSKHWCGGPHSAYCRTEDLQYLAPELHLGSAMAVSGAAAAPNMGSYTSSALVMLMTLLNIRLGLWLPNPRRVRRLVELGEIEEVRGLAGRLRRWLRRLLAQPSGYYLVHEMFSRLNARRPYVNLSDGGHLENTGAYELLRRRCKLILIGDAEADPEVHFGSLAALIRYARIDLGTEITMDLGPLRPGADGASDEHYTFGTIRYPPDGDHGPKTGYLLYIKTSLSGDEGEAIREYRARHPDFPHESTADQAFEEDQFEAYRALGFHIGDGLSARAGEIGPKGGIDAWISSLAPAPLPD